MKAFKGSQDRKQGGSAPQVGEPGVEAEHSNAGGEGVEAELEVAGRSVGRASQQAAGRSAAVQRSRLALRPGAARVPQRVYDGVEHYAVRLAPLRLHRLERLRREKQHSFNSLHRQSIRDRRFRVPTMNYSLSRMNLVYVFKRYP